MQQQSTGAYEPIRSNNEPGLAGLAGIEGAFVHNWAGLAGAFGMSPVLGRIHALAYLHCDPITASDVGRRFDIAAEEAEVHLRELAGLGVVREIPGTGYVADADPWSWFLGTLRERGRREFGPLLASIREANARAQAMRGAATGEPSRRIERIARFTQFVDQIAGLIETFATLGAGPMLSAMRMVAKMRGPRLLRI